MHAAGDVRDQDSAEKAFFTALTCINVSCEALMDASSSIDNEVTRKQIRTDRAIPHSLLHYLWQARNGDVHDVLVWNMQGAEFHLAMVDEKKARRRLRRRRHIRDDASLLMFAYDVNTEEKLLEKISANEQPDPDRMTMAGIASTPVRASINLSSFHYMDRRGKQPRRIDVSEPTEHLGKSIPPVALNGIYLGISYYNDKLQQLSALAGAVLPAIELPPQHEIGGPITAR
jgi:hypothetical protein